MKTPINLIYDAFKNSGKSGFMEWMVENEQFLKDFEIFYFYYFFK